MRFSILQEAANYEEHGFLGKMGYCQGHPHLEELMIKQKMLLPKESPNCSGKASVQGPSVDAIAVGDASVITSPLTVSVSSGEKQEGANCKLFERKRAVLHIVTNSACSKF